MSTAAFTQIAASLDSMCQRRISCELADLAPLHAAELGDLDKVKRFVKLTAFVNCVDSYTAQPQVADGASKFLGEIFGENGKHARSAVGVSGLPLNVPVEIEAIVEVSE